MSSLTCSPMVGVKVVDHAKRHNISNSQIEPLFHNVAWCKSLFFSLSQKTLPFLLFGSKGGSA